MRTVATIGAGEMRMMLARFAESVEEQHAMLTDLDCASGDGDHGTTMLQGVGRIRAVLAVAGSEDTPGQLLANVSVEFFALDGGAAGSLFGTIFAGMAEGCAGNAELDAAAFGAALDQALRKLQGRSGARAGDKTMLDALIPAVAAFRADASGTLGIRSCLITCLQAAAQAASAGAMATRAMVARFGRAKNLGARTLGYQDPGSTSVALLFGAFRDALSVEGDTAHG